MELVNGQKVLIKSLKKLGIFLKKINSQSALINLGKLELKIALSDLEIIPEEKISRHKKLPHKSPKVKRSNKKKSLKIDYHGYSREACLVDFEQRLSQAYLDKTNEIIVVHGRGQGILKKALIDYLQSVDLKLSFRSGAVNENELIIKL